MAAVTAYPIDPPSAKVRRVRLHVIGGHVDIDDFVPATRGDCPPTSASAPCPHVKCRHHLWRVESDEQPGRPWPGYKPAPELRSVQFDWPLPPSCSLDEADRVAATGETMPVAAVARNLDARNRQTFLLLKRARRKLGASASALLPEDR